MQRKTLEGKKGVVKICIDGNDCYIVPKGSGKGQPDSTCIGELKIKGDAYQVVTGTQYLESSAKPDKRIIPTKDGQSEENSECTTILSSIAAARLTCRELQIAHLVAKGLLNKQIADRLDLSVYTISTHLRRIFIKLEVHNRTALVSKLLEKGKNC